MKTRRREILIVSAVSAAAALAGATLGPLLLNQRDGGAELERYPFRDLNGGARRISEWKDKVRICNFWATWCAPCREEIPMLNALRAKNVSKGVEIVGIALDSADNVREFSKTLPILYPVLLADMSTVSLMRTLGNSAGALPYTVVLDRRGSITARKLGALKQSEAENLISRVTAN